MALAREVAEAYIQVTGDMRRFRNAVQTQGREIADKAGEDLGKRFNKSFGDELRKGDSFKKLTDNNSFKDLERDFQTLAKATKTKDFDEFFRRFNSNTELSRRRVRAVTSQMQKFGRITPQEVDRVVKSFDQFIDRQKKATNFDNAQFRHRIKEMERDFQEFASLSDHKGFERFWRRFGNDSSAARKRVAEVTREMVKNNRMTEAQSKALRDMAREYDNSLKAAERARIASEQARAAAKKEEEANRKAEKARLAAKREEEAQARRIAAEHEKARKAAERQAERNRRLHRSFKELQKITAVKDLERDFERLARASRDGNFKTFFRSVGSDAGKARARISEVTDEMVKMGRMSDKSRVQVKNMFEEFNRGRRSVNRVERAFQGFQRTVSKGLGKLRNSWMRMDSTVRLVLTLIAAAAGPIAAMLSTLGSSIVSIASSLAMAAVNIVPLVGIFATAGLGIGLMVSAMDKMRKRFPSINRGLDRISQAWNRQTIAFAKFAGPGVGRLLNNLATELGRVDFGTPIGKAMGGISSAFAHVVNSSGFRALMNAFTREYPRALRGMGAGFASVFGTLSSLLAGAAPLAERLGYSFREWSRGLYASAEAARQNGQMQKVFDLAGRSLQSVLRLVRALGNLLGAVFMATADHGNALLDTLSGIINKFTEWIRSAEGIKSINSWFATANKLLGPMGNLLGATGRALASLVTPATIDLAENFLNIMSEWIPKLGLMLVAVSKLDILGNLAHLLNTVSTAMEPMIPTITELAQTLGTFLRDAITAVGPLISGMARAWEPLVNVMLNVAQFVVPLVIGAIDFVANAFNSLPQPIQSATTALIVIGGMWSTWTGLLMKAAGPFKAVIQNFRSFSAALTTLGGHIMTAARMIGTVLPQAVMILFNLIRAHPIGMLITAIGAAVGVLTWFFTSTETGQRIWQGFMDVLSSVGAVVGPAIQSAFQSITSTLQTFWNWIQNVGQTVASTFQTMVGSAGEGASGIKSRMQPLIDFVKGTFGRAFEEARAIIAPALQGVADAAAPLIPAFVEAGQQIVQALQPLVKMIIGEVLPLAIELYATWSSMWMQVVAAVLPAVSQIIQAVVPLVTTLLGELIPAFAQIVKAVVPVVTTLISQLVPAFIQIIQAVLPVIVTLVGQLIPVITQVIAAVLPLVTMLISQLVPAFLAIATTVISVAAQIISAILPVVAQVIAAFLQLVTFVIGILVPVIQEILKIVVVVFEAIVPIIQGALTIVMGIINTVMSIIKGDWQGAWDGIKQILQGVWDVIKGVVQGAIAIVSQVIQSTMTLISAAWSAVWNAIKSVTSSVWNAIKSVISTVINSIKSTISTVWNGIKSFISTTMNAIRNTFSTIWNAIKSVISSVVNGIRSTINTVWNGIKSFISNTMNNIRDTFSRIWTAIKIVITNNVNNIKSTISSVWNGIKSFISLVMNSIRNTFSSIWNAIRNVISSVVNGIRNAVSIGFNGARNAGVNAFNFMRNAVSNTINGLLNTVRNAANSIKSAFSNIVGSMRTIGRNIIQGLINGVSSMGSMLANAAKNVAKGAMNAIKGIFGIKSPSKEMRKVGVWIGEGLNLGLGDEEKEVAKGMEQLGEAALSGMDVQKYMNAGVEAAEAFANGLSSVDLTGILEPKLDDLSRRAGVQRVGTGRPREDDLRYQRAGGTTIEEGAIQVNTPAQDGKIVAKQMVDELVRTL